MTVTSHIEEVSNTRKKLNISVNAQFVNSTYQENLKSIQQKAEMKGFRKGKVPAPLVQKFFKEDLYKNTVNALVEEGFSKSIVDVDFQIVSQPNIDFDTNVNFNEIKDFQFTAIIDINPKIEIVGYTELNLELPETKDLGKELTENSQKGDPSLAPFMQQFQKIVKKISKDKYFQEAQSLIMDQVLAKNDFEVAESLVESSIDRIIQGHNQSNPEKNLSPKDPKVRDSFQEEAIQQVKQIIALGHIVRQENLTVSDEEVAEEFYLVTMTAPNLKNNQEKLSKIYGEVKANLLMQKALEFIISKSHVTYIKPKEEPLPLENADKLEDGEKVALEESPSNPEGQETQKTE